MKTCAVKNGDVYVINGTKTFISNAPVANIIILYASSNKDKGFHGGISAFVIEKNSNGLQVSAPFDKMGLKTCTMAEIQFKNVTINNSLMLGKEGAGSFMF